MVGQPGWHFWFIGFGLTLALEAPWVLSLLKEFEPHWVRRVFALLFANLATHPLVWFLFPAMPLRPALALTASELWALLAEWLFYAVYVHNLGVKRAFGLSLAANATSFTIGWGIFHWFGAALFRV
jgi:hypothetical protein